MSMSKPFNEYLAAAIARKEQLNGKGREISLNDLYVGTLWDLHPDIACQVKGKVEGDEHSIVEFLNWVREKMYEQQLAATE